MAAISCLTHALRIFVAIFVAIEPEVLLVLHYLQQVSIIKLLISKYQHIKVVMATLDRVKYHALAMTNSLYMNSTTKFIKGVENQSLSPRQRIQPGTFPSSQSLDKTKEVAKRHSILHRNQSNNLAKEAQPNRNPRSPNNKIQKVQQDVKLKPVQETALKMSADVYLNSTTKFVKGFAELSKMQANNASQSPEKKNPPVISRNNQSSEVNRKVILTPIKILTPNKDIQQQVSTPIPNITSILTYYTPQQIGNRLTQRHPQVVSATVNRRQTNKNPENTAQKMTGQIYLNSTTKYRRKTQTTPNEQPRASPQQMAQQIQLIQSGNTNVSPNRGSQQTNAHKMAGQVYLNSTTKFTRANNPKEPIAQSHSLSKLSPKKEQNAYKMAGQAYMNSTTKYRAQQDILPPNVTSSPSVSPKKVVLAVKQQEIKAITPIKSTIGLSSRIVQKPQQLLPRNRFQTEIVQSKPEISLSKDDVDQIKKIERKKQKTRSIKFIDKTDKEVKEEQNQATQINTKNATPTIARKTSPLPNQQSPSIINNEGRHNQFRNSNSNNQLLPSSNRQIKNVTPVPANKNSIANTQIYSNKVERVNQGSKLQIKNYPAAKSPATVKNSQVRETIETQKVTNNPGKMIQRKQNEVINTVLAVKQQIPKKQIQNKETRAITQQSIKDSSNQVNYLHSSQPIKKAVTHEEAKDVKLASLRPSVKNESTITFNNNEKQSSQANNKKIIQRKPKQVQKSSTSAHLNQHKIESNGSNIKYNQRANGQTNTMNKLAASKSNDNLNRVWSPPTNSTNANANNATPTPFQRSKPPQVPNQVWPVIQKTDNVKLQTQNIPPKKPIRSQQRIESLRNVVSEEKNIAYSNQIKSKSDKNIEDSKKHVGSETIIKLLKNQAQPEQITVIAKKNLPTQILSTSTISKAENNVTLYKNKVQPAKQISNTLQSPRSNDVQPLPANSAPTNAKKDSLQTEKANKSISLKKSDALYYVLVKLILPVKKNAIDNICENSKTKNKHARQLTILVREASSFVHHRSINIYGSVFDQLKKYYVSVPQQKKVLNSKANSGKDHAVSIITYLIQQKIRNLFQLLKTNIWAGAQIMTANSFSEITKNAKLETLNNRNELLKHNLPSIISIARINKINCLLPFFNKILLNSQRVNASKIPNQQRSSLFNSKVTKETAISRQKSPKKSRNYEAEWNAVKESKHSLESQVSQIEFQISQKRRYLNNERGNLMKKMETLGNKNKLLDNQVALKRKKKEEYQNLISKEQPKNEQFNVVSQEKSPLIEILTKIYSEVFNCKSQEINCEDIIKKHHINIEQRRQLIQEWSILAQNIKIKTELQKFEGSNKKEQALKKSLREEQVRVCQIMSNYVRESYLWQWVHIAVLNQ